MRQRPPDTVGGEDLAMLTTLIELAVALTFIGLAGHILIRLWQNQHDGDGKQG